MSKWLACTSGGAGTSRRCAPDECLDDGLVAVVIMRQKGALYTVSLSRAIYSGAHLNDDTVRFPRAR